MSCLKGREGVRWGVTKCNRGGGSVALRDVAPVEVLEFVKLALPYLLTLFVFTGIYQPDTKDNK